MPQWLTRVSRPPREQIAPTCASVLQAIYMRKWMNERLKRRKKTGDGSPKEASKAPAQEPLQPRFYDNEQAAAPAVPSAAPIKVPADVRDEAPVAPSQHQESRRRSRPEPESASESASQSTAASEAASAGAVEPRPRVSRRRRSRGRGGNRPRKASSSSVPVVAGALSAAEPPAAESPVRESSEHEPAAKPPADSLPAQALPGQAVPAQPLLVQTAPAPARASKGTVVLAIGLPGSGKSSWFKRHNIHPLSSDLLRELLFDDAQEQRFQDLVFSNLRSMLKARLIARRPMNYVDATNLTPHDRHSWIKLAKDYGYDVQGLFFDVPLEVCMERHQRRGRAVPEDIMRKMAGKLKPPTFEEGFSKITVVRVKQKE